MPTSHHENIAPIVTAILRLAPQSVLDLGCGFGKYGVLLREYLDITPGRIDRPTWSVRIDALEGFTAYRNPVWYSVYDAVHVGPAEDLLPTLGNYDVILMADVIEHLEKPRAVRLMSQALSQAKAVVVSTPRTFFPQPDVNDNEFERHRCLWTRADFPSGVQVLSCSGTVCNVYVASNAPLSPWILRPASIPELVYQRARAKLRAVGRWGWPVAATLRWLTRWLG